MAAGSTYTPIATYSASGSVATYTFSSIPSTYTDIIFVVKGSLAGADAAYLRFNGDTTSNYTRIYVYGSGTGTGSGSIASETGIAFSMGTDQGNTILHIFNYANTTTKKSVVLRNDYLSNAAVKTVGMWQTSNTAISSISLTTASGNNFTSGTMLTLYGIAAA
jgi:hypothetical protein